MLLIELISQCEQLLVELEGNMCTLYEFSSIHTEACLLYIYYTIIIFSDALLIKYLPNHHGDYHNGYRHLYIFSRYESKLRGRLGSSDPDPGGLFQGSQAIR